MSSKEKPGGKSPQGGLLKVQHWILNGDWKTYMPVRDLEKCTKCLMCVLYCRMALFVGVLNWVK